MDHAIFDKRKYPIVGVREGYGQWVRTYEKRIRRFNLEIILAAVSALTILSVWFFIAWWFFQK